MTIYELIAEHGADTVAAWIGGEEVPGFEPLTEEEVEQLATSWPVWARPGQRWVPGPERITYYSAGRGFGKSLVLSHAIGEAAMEPTRWGYEAMLLGITPADARALIEQDTGIIRVATACGYPQPETRWGLRGELFFPPPPGETRGLHLRIASSAKPESTRGPNVGLLLADEWAFFHDTTDEQGLTAWESAMNTLRIGEAKALIVSSPSQKPAVREMRKAAEEPRCVDRQTPEGRIPGCGATLPRLAPTRISPLFSATTTEPRRVCPACGAEVIARVRLISASTLDNRANIQADYIAMAEEFLAAGSRRALGEYGGQILDDATSSPVPSIKVHDLAGFRFARDPWGTLRRELRITRVVIQVDPATTGGEGSADTGVLAVGVTAQEGSRRPRVYGLQDWSVAPAEVEGSPSRVWAPRVAVLAALWRAEEVCIETNQGGLEVLDPARVALAGVTEAQVREAARAAGVDLDPVAVAEALRAARRAEVVGITRRVDKAARWDWASGPASTGDLSLLRSPWLPADHWRETVAHITRFAPSSTGRRKGRESVDRGDTLIAAAQRLLGAREGEGVVIDPTASPVFTEGRMF